MKTKSLLAVRWDQNKIMPTIQAIVIASDFYPI